MTTSVFEFVTKEIDANQIIKMEIIDNIGFKNKTGDFKNRNFVLRIKDKTRPLIFEIENSENLSIAEGMITEITNSSTGYHL